MKLKFYLCLCALFFIVACGGEKKTGRRVVIVENNEQQRNSTPQPNPFLASDVYSTTQVNLAHTNSFTAPIPKGTFTIELTTENQLLSGLVNVATIASGNPNYMWAISTDRFTCINTNEGNFGQVRNFFNYPDAGAFHVEKHRDVLLHNYTSIEEIQRNVFAAYGNSPEQRLSKGTIAVCDKNTDVFINYGTQIACLIDLNKPRFRNIFDVTQYTPNPTNIVGLGITYDGMLVFASQTYIGVIDRAFDTIPKIYHFEPNELCNKAFCIDENNGIYVATNKKMRKLVWTGQELSDKTADGAWVAAYKTGKQGAVSTPSLMGFDYSDDKLVVIVDGKNNLTAFWRNEIPANTQRIADEIKLSFASTEKPVSAAGLAINNTGIFVANNSLYANTGDAIVDAIATVVKPSAQGCERFEWMDDTKQFKSIFVNKSISTATMKPAVSTTSNIVCVNGFYPETGWEVTGLDWNTGSIVHRSLFGHNNLGNAAFATLQYFPNGNMLFNSIGGPCRIQLTH
ncbi:MAG: hypothetical protein LBM68_00750 [Bacteroidales bacterium]|jgi:hypothetical protein|nr:hypothetical protein [Bacteroidales bacterium]